MEPLYLYGCRHDILGHYLKAIGLLRVLSLCADKANRDPDAEGWWDLEHACFCLCSPKYPTKEKLVEFFANHYQPTPFFSPWNTGGGLNEKKEIEFSIAQTSWNEFWTSNRDAIVPLIADVPKHEAAVVGLKLGADTLKLTLSGILPELTPHPDISVVQGASKGKNPKPFIELSWSETAKARFFQQLAAHRPFLEQFIKFTNAVKKKFVRGSTSLCFEVQNEDALKLLPEMPGVGRDVRIKESGKKAVMALLAKSPRLSSELKSVLDTGRTFFSRFGQDDADDHSLLEEMRESVPPVVAEAMDAVFTTRSGKRIHNNPLFLNRGKGEGGNDELFRSFWGNFVAASQSMSELVPGSLFGISVESLPKDGGAPFFPDAIKAYNSGSSWKVEDYPFNPLDYVLAVEGAFALKGAVGRNLAANARRFAAFPFVFDSGDDMLDKEGDLKGTASSFWFPIWNRRTTYDELASFIGDAQARLPSKDAQFSAEFMRALNSQGVDAGFCGWQEFRAKLIMSTVPWVTSGKYLATENRTEANYLNRALRPLDECRFLDQFDLYRNKKTGKLEKEGPHRFRKAINTAMETAVQETTPRNCLDLLAAVFRACRQMAISKSFRDTLPGKDAHFFCPLPMEDWNVLFGGFGQAEFRIARAVASMVGLQQQQNGKCSTTLPTFGSILPLKLPHGGRWYLPQKPEPPSHQAVWSGTDLCHDLAVVLGRRYMDSLSDDQPALVSAFGAPLGDVLAFLRGELDDQVIARWTEALSLIEWRLIKVEEQALSNDEWYSVAIPPEYAALRTVLELECERREVGDRKKRRSQLPISLLCQRSASMLPLAVTEALRWIGIWGVPNPYGMKAEAEKKRLSGRDIISLPSAAISFSTDAGRLAASVCVPLHWRDRKMLYRAVSLPQVD
jgi:CRISPR-associated protein Csx17